jgi:hypothetical protein
MQLNESYAPKQWCLFPDLPVRNVPLFFYVPQVFRPGILGPKSEAPFTGLRFRL